MTPEDKQFVREQASHNRPDIQRLLTLLIEAEAMRRKAEFYQAHPKGNCRVSVQPYTLETKFECDERHNWSDADWIADTKKKELVG